MKMCFLPYIHMHIYVSVLVHCLARGGLEKFIPQALHMSLRYDSVLKW